MLLTGTQGSFIPEAEPPAGRVALAAAGYRADIDGLRAVAVLSVLLFHADSSLLPGGFAGVDVFFVISGYLITGILVRELQRGVFSLESFYSRRIRRIFPALILVLTGTWILGWLFALPSEFRSLGERTALGAAFVANIGVYIDNEWYFRQGAPDPLLHLWSLGVEEQFYIVWPVLILLMFKARRLIGPIIVVTAACFLLNTAAAVSDPLADYYLPWNRLWELSAGALLSCVELRKHSTLLRTETHATLTGLAGGSMLVASFVFLDGSGRTAFPGWWGILPVAGTMLIILAGQSGWVGRSALASKPVVFMGLISYPLYLWHLPLLSLTHQMGWSSRVGTWLAIFSSVVLAIATYVYVELPIRRHGVSRRLVIYLFAAMMLCGAVGVATHSGVIDSRSSGYALERYLRPATEDWLPLAESGNSDKPSHWTSVVDGFLELGIASRQTLFIGDSFMQQYYQRVQKVLMDNPESPRGAVFAVRAGCVPGGVELLHHVLSTSRVTDCRAFLNRSLDYARKDSIDTVVIGGSWYTYFSENRPVEGSSEHASQWRGDSELGLSELRRVISGLVNDHKRVFLVLSHPSGAQFEPKTMIERKILSPAFVVHPREFVARADIWNGDGKIAVALRRLAEESGATVIDPSNQLCEGQKCRALTPDGEPIYHDAGHLRPSYAKDHATFLDQTLLKPLGH